MKDTSLVHNIQVLCQKFAEFHYNKHLKENNIIKIQEEQIEKKVDEIMTKEKEKELKQYVRASLKAMYKTDYNSFSVENILSEIFEDRNEIITRISVEIRHHQK